MTESSRESHPNFFMRLILYHYRSSTKIKSPEEIAREAWLIPRLIPFNRWCSLPAAFFIQFCCGSLYAWSVFNQPIDIWIYGKVTNMAPITFYIVVGCFGCAAATTGPWLERRGPMPCCLIGTTLFYTGNLLSGLALYLKQIWLLYIGYGIVSGFGLGLCYICPVSAIQKWFPDKRGMAAGFAVCGFGAGAIAIAKVQIPLITHVGLPLTFVILGSCYWIVMATCALVLRTPPPGFVVNGMTVDGCDPKDQESQSRNQMSLIEALTSCNFRLMYCMLLANAIFGLVLISRLSNILTDVFGRSADEAATIVAINGGFNLGGRIFFAVISDFMGRKACFIILLTSQLAILAAFSTTTSTGTYWAFLFSMWTVTACYGSGFGVIPAFLTDTFGSANIGACHGIILTSWSLAGVVGGIIFTEVFNFITSSTDPPYDKSDPWAYNLNVWWIFGVVVIGWFCLMFVSPTEKDRRFFRKICCCVLRFHGDRKPQSYTVRS